MQLVEEVKFDNSYSFIYSQRPGTPAAGMKDNVSDAEKKQRLNELQELLNVYATERSEKLLGSIQSCLVSGKSKKNKDEYQARTECNRVVNFDSNGIDLVVNWLIFELMMFWLTHSEEPSNTKALYNHNLNFSNLSPDRLQLLW